jgi:hypothetical protein
MMGEGVANGVDAEQEETKIAAIGLENWVSMRPDLALACHSFKYFVIKYGIVLLYEGR